jgi:hypothetical protein
MDMGRRGGPLVGIAGRELDAMGGVGRGVVLLADLDRAGAVGRVPAGIGAVTEYVVC